MALRVPLRLAPTTGQWRENAFSACKRSRGHLLWILVWSVTAVAATVAAPVLISTPLLLMALAPRALFVALAAREADLLVFLVLGTVRLSVTDPSYFVVGRRLSPDEPHSRRFDRGPAFVRCMYRCWPLACAVLFLRPNARYVGVAGVCGVPAALVAAATTLGTVTYLVLVHLGIGLIP